LGEALDDDADDDPDETTAPDELEPLSGQNGLPVLFGERFGRE